MAVDKLAKAALRGKGLGGGLSSDGNQTARNIYPAIVISNEDPLGMKRIIARIIDPNNLGEQGSTNFGGGRDRDTLDGDLPFCVPMFPNHFHIIPLVDEMVYIFLENPSDNTAPRYYLGSQVNSPFKLRFQAFDEAHRVFKDTDFNLNAQKDSKLTTKTVFPKLGDIAIQGRDDADLMLKPREVFLTAGKFVKGTTEINQDYPSQLQLIQQENDNEENDDLIPNYSQANINSTNINLYSPRGVFRDEGIANFEINDDLESFDGVASALHPAVFGDELIKLLDIMIRVILNHIHTPHKALVPIPESDQLSSYTIEGELQKLISNHIRIN